MSTQTSMSLDVNIYEVMDFYADVFEVEKNEMIIYDENILDSDVVLFINEKNRYDILKENGQIEIDRLTKDIYPGEELN